MSEKKTLIVVVVIDIIVNDPETLSVWSNFSSLKLYSFVRVCIWANDQYSEIKNCVNQCFLLFDQMTTIQFI